MLVGGCWPAMDTTLEVIVVDQQWRQPWWCVVAGLQSRQSWWLVVVGQHLKCPCCCMVVGVLAKHGESHSDGTAMELVVVGQRGRQP